MKNLFVFILILLLFGCTPENPTPNPNFTIGQSYQGGIIAYIDASGLHGLIAAPSDQGATEWGCSNSGISGATEISGADGTAIYTGAQNTIDIINGCNEVGIAARLCGDLVLGGYSDWYLPSKDELNKLYLNRVAIGGFVQSDYWSSSEYDVIFVWLMSFGNNYMHFVDKNSSAYVRAVRSF